MGPLGIQLPRRLTEKVSQESITSEPNNSSHSHGGADYHGNGNKGREECHDTGSLNGKPRWPAHGHRGFLVQRNHESGGIVIVYSVPEECGFGNGAISTFCNRDIFAIPNSASVIQLRPLADKPASTPEPAGTFGSGSV